MQLRSQKGSFFVIIIGALFLLSFVGGAFYLLSTNQKSDSKAGASHDPKKVFEELRAQVEHSLDDPLAMEMSMQRNSNHFSCMFTSRGGCAGKGGGFLLFPDANPQSQPLSQLVKGQGLNIDGLGCQGFPSEDCAFRVTSSWAPVCAPGDCLNTNSFRVNVAVVFEDPKNPLKWEKEALVQPNLRLTESVQCERSGRAWTGTTCVENGGGNRVIASDSDRPDANLRSDAMDRNGPVRESQEMPEGFQKPQEDPYICPDNMTIQGKVYTLEMMGPNNSQVRVPAINGCPAEDIFKFNCAAKNPPSFAGEGQWIQIEAEMAPNCDDRGAPTGEPIRN